MIELLNAIADRWFSWELAIAWQAAVLIAIVWVIDLLIRKWAWPQVRYALWMLVLVKLILPPTLTSPASFTAEIPILVQKAAQLQSNQPQATPEIIEVSEPAASAGETAGRDTAGHYTEASNEQRGAALAAPSTSTLGAPAAVSLSWKAYALIVWLLGIVILSAWLVARLAGLQREHLKGDQRAELPEEFKELLASTAQKLDLKRAPRVILTDKVCCPAVFGIFRPVLLMPAGKLENLSMADTEHILLHELAHIKRGDLVIHAAYMILQIVYWFNPLLWMIRKQLQNLRELCCDGTVARLLREKTPQYRETLLETARQLLAEPVDPGLGLLGLFENSNWLVERLKWLEKKTWKNRPVRILTIFVLVCVMSATVLPMAKLDPGPPGLTIKGRITDAITGKPIAGARIFDDPYGPGPDWQKIESGFYEPDLPQWGAITNANGEYAFLTWHEHHSFKVEADGYKDERGTLYSGHFTIPTKDIEIYDFALTPEKTDVEVEGEKPEIVSVNPTSGSMMSLISEIEVVFNQSMIPDLGKIVNTTINKSHRRSFLANASAFYANITYDSEQHKFTIPLMLPPDWKGSIELREFRTTNGIKVDPIVLNYSTSREIYSTEFQERFQQAKQSDELRDILNKIKEARLRITSLSEIVHSVYKIDNRDMISKSIFKFQGKGQFYADISERMHVPFYVGSDGKDCWHYNGREGGENLVTAPFDEVAEKDVLICDPFGVVQKGVSKTTESLNIEYLGTDIFENRKHYLLRVWSENLREDYIRCVAHVAWIDAETHMLSQMISDHGSSIMSHRFIYDQINQSIADSEFSPEYTTDTERSAPRELDEEYDTRFLKIIDGSNGRMGVRWGERGLGGTISSGLN